MTRKRVVLAYITDDSQRKASFKKRKRGMVNKMREISVLCGVEACAVIYSQYDCEPIVWPSRVGAQAVLELFKRLPDMDRAQKMVNQEIFMRQRIKKAENQLIRVRRENKLSELEISMFQCMAGKASMDDLNMRDAADMRLVISQFRKKIESKMNELKQAEKQNQSVASTSMADA